ncbi:hypothetical protein C8J57DRAFT_1634459 [Mycena rebaudengoi]|nr:hypothetical protein C8J57DRAFT_1634459 [Mycena rebaudengoi]
MKVPTQLKNVIQYTTVAANTVEAIAGSSEIPFLSSATALTLSILKYVEAIRSNKDDWMIMVEQIHYCNTVLHIGNERGASNGTLQKKGKIKQPFKQLDNASKLGMCKQELHKAVGMFRVRAGDSTLSQIGQIKTDAKQQHDELMALLDSHPDLGSLDCSSVIGTLSSSGNSSGSFSLLPASPKIFHGREAELQDVVNILVQDSAHITILGAGGMGKTTLATAALHKPQVEAKYSHQYFVPCHSSPTCNELAATISDHIGLEKGSNMAKKIAHYFDHAPPSLLVLDNLETPVGNLFISL